MTICTGRVGTKEQAMISPVGPFELILGNGVSFILMAFVDVRIVFTAGVLLFDVPMSGPPALLFLAAETVLWIVTVLSRAGSWSRPGRPAEP